MGRRQRVTPKMARKEIPVQTEKVEERLALLRNSAYGLDSVQIQLDLRSVLYAYSKLQMLIQILVLDYDKQKA